MTVVAPKFIIFISFTIALSFSFQFEDGTNEIFSVDGNIGLIAAFGHFNSDEFTDLVVLQQRGTKLQLRFGSDKQPYFQDSSIGPINCTFGKVITSVVPADFNGDSVVDMLITLQLDDIHSIEKELEVKILWGVNNSIDCKAETILRLSNQPLVIDFNGDMIPDIIGEDEQGKRFVWVASTKKSFHSISLSSSVDQRLHKDHSSGLIDINHDMAPDILIMGKDYIEIWIHSGASFAKDDSYSIKKPICKRMGQATFLDMNLDEKLDIILPVCYDDSCKSSAVLIWNANLSQWDTLLNDFINPNDKEVWGFKVPLGRDMTVLDMNALIFTLRSGDIDLDGYPDFIVVLQSKAHAGRVQGVILRNIPCEGCLMERTLQIDWSVSGLKDVQDIQLATFFDLFEDGTLDILAVTKNKEWHIHSLVNSEVLDSCFLKVLVLNGLWQNSYRSYGTLPYGVNQPGPMVKYNITKHDGKPLTSTSIQLSQSGFFPLLLPYSLFGLGPTPNFIDVLTVSIPAEFNQTVHKREWVQIIPNSQIVVIPRPPKEEKLWQKKLFVTPSHLVLLTLISLIGTCIFLSLLVALLHWNERREDKKEKMQDAYRFHFDAM